MRLEEVTKLFGVVGALVNASLAIEPGEVVAVMGPNGAGKSTLLSILSLTMRPTRGQVLFNGEKASLSDTHARVSRKIGFLSHLPLVYPDLTGVENLRLFGQLYGVEQLEDVVKSVSEELNLGGFGADRPTRVLSRGQLQRVALARALIAEPDLLLLDEPAAGLDSASVGRIAEVLDKLRARNGMAVVVTHEPEVAARVASRAVFVTNGRIAADVQAPSSADGFRTLYNEVLDGGGG